MLGGAETCLRAVVLPWSFAKSVGDTVGAYAFVPAKAEAAVTEVDWRCVKYRCHGFGGFEASLRGWWEKKGHGTGDEACRFGGLLTPPSIRVFSIDLA